MVGLNGVIERFKLHMHRWPRALDELVTKPANAADGDAPYWEGPYIRDAQRKDPFGGEWRYRAPGEHNTSRFDLSSAGQDGQWGTADDIANW